MIELKKMYSAFVSSAYSTMKKERSEVIDALLDYRIFPICMEHFTVSADKNFNDITSLIDQSDIFIILLGKYYGTVADNHKSITENEYNYAKEHNIKSLAIITNDLMENLNLSKDEQEKLSIDEKCQIEFALSVPYAKRQNQDVSIGRIVSQFLGNLDLSACHGWVREVNVVDNEFINEYQSFDLRGKWYHVHMSNDDPSYIRTGFFEINQTFDRENYKKLSINGTNYNIKYDKEKGTFKENVLKSTIWSGDYALDDNGNIKGIFEAKRTYTDNFNNVIVNRGTRRGIHDFIIDNTGEKTTSFCGYFHDEAPSPKIGVIMIFRDINERNEFIKANLEEALEANAR